MPSFFWFRRTRFASRIVGSQVTRLCDGEVRGRLRRAARVALSSAVAVGYFAPPAEAQLPQLTQFTMTKCDAFSCEQIPDNQEGLDLDEAIGSIVAASGPIVPGSLMICPSETSCGITFLPSEDSIFFAIEAHCMSTGIDPNTVTVDCLAEFAQPISQGTVNCDFDAQVQDTSGGTLNVPFADFGAVANPSGNAFEICSLQAPSHDGIPQAGPCPEGGGPQPCTISENCPFPGNACTRPNFPPESVEEMAASLNALLGGSDEFDARNSGILRIQQAVPVPGLSLSGRAAAALLILAAGSWAIAMQRRRASGRT